MQEFLDWFGDIHKLETAYAETTRQPRHEKSAKALFDASLTFLGRIPSVPGNRVLDVGLGYGHHARWFAEHGSQTTGISVHVTPELEREAAAAGYEVRHMDMHFLDYGDCAFDVVWSHHSLEHSFSPLLALREWYRVLKPGGSLAVTVPPHKTEVVSGHFNVGWSVGQLMYLLAVSGYDTASGHFVEEGYNVRALVQRPLDDIDPAGLSWMFKARERFPDALRERMHDAPGSLGRCSFDGRIAEAHGHDYVRRKTPSALALRLQAAKRGTRRSWRRLRNKMGAKP